MGRTNATFRDLLRHTEREWADYRRALRRRDREHFDRLFDHARDHADAAGNLNPTDPVPALLLSVVLAQERERARLEERVEEQAERLAARAARIDELEATVDELEEAVDRLEATFEALAVRTLEGDQRELPPADERAEADAAAGRSDAVDRSA